MKSVNTFSLSGRLTSDARFFDGKNGRVARFSIAHNFGKGMPALFADVVMFGKNGNKDVDISEELLTKGTPVLVSGYFRVSVTSKDGVTYENKDMVATSCEPLEAEAEDAE